MRTRPIPPEAATGRVVASRASAGLGAELAGLFAADGHDVVIVARRQDKLAALAAQIKA
jgi:uncharacterized protein